MPIEIVEEFTAARWLPAGAIAESPVGTFEMRRSLVTKDCGYAGGAAPPWPEIAFFVTEDGTNWVSSDLREIDDKASRCGRDELWMTRSGQRVRLRVRIGDGPGDRRVAVRIGMRIVPDDDGSNRAPRSALC